MNTRFALTLMIGIVLLVGFTMEEGGTLDKVARGNREIAQADVAGEERAAPVVRAAAVTPNPQAGSDSWNWFNEAEPTEPAVVPSRPATRSQASSPSSPAEEGALARHRHNLEE
ncbi:hypothetical protein [Aurantiacibacter poecillastricola]|uniref:hypothetical protein n=1 Tax=Aurantiacibacter poecillastricola TaxID=3064385 RepID=UPI00273F26F2|nr:hypothetical protein [Aurantiacibacter sp. 219JJ12-13]MDP5260626.1 hypothetical protein [Aurantiacibacter sp. 219JJ12-13]